MPRDDCPINYHPSWKVDYHIDRYQPRAELASKSIYWLIQHDLDELKKQKKGKVTSF